MVTPAQQIANDIEAVEAYLLARLTTDFPMFDDVQLGKYDGDADSFQGIFTVAYGEDDQRIAYLFHTEPEKALNIQRL